MSAREKTRDELDMKTLRELAALPINKTCFDCGQRGPTYVNVTIGSFVCSACGGLLRGLNPPHRVKSLTVCSFTEVEMDRIKSRGNEYCTHIWLGKFDPKTMESDLSSPDKRREFMIQKYEEKRYYIDPKEAIKRMKPRAPAVPSVPSSVSQSKSHTVIPSRQSSQLQRPFLSQTFSSTEVSQHNLPDLFNNFEGKDPFVDSKQKGDAMEDDSFADFSSAFGTASVGSSSHKKPAPPPPDRYAPLADLDNQQHQQEVFWPTVFVPANPFSSTWSQPAANPFQNGHSKSSLQNGWPSRTDAFGSPAANPFTNGAFAPAQPRTNTGKNPFL